MGRCTGSSVAGVIAAAAMISLAGEVGTARAATEAVVYSFQGFPDGAYPVGRLAELGGTIYGTTLDEGPSGYGTVFSLKPGGVETVLHGFTSGADGASPVGLLAYNGTLYGATNVGGGQGCLGSGCGTVFQVTTAGIESVIATFKVVTAKGPAGGLARIGAGLFGASVQGGAPRFGTVFRVNPAGGDRLVYTFQGGNDGRAPYGDLTEAAGTLYGATEFGGGTGGRFNIGFGTIFAAGPTGTESVLHAFAGTDGQTPQGGLLKFGNVLYGTAAEGGAYGYGTAFKLGLDGTFTKLYDFKGGADGAYPNGNLVEHGGVFYGTTRNGGGTKTMAGGGTVFSLTPAGRESVVYAFPCCSAQDGLNPMAGLLDVGGTLYGTTSNGGAHSRGTVFSVVP